ncbi:MAG: hypothetical protein AB7O37_08115 [Vicinamibacteria bacterium]
MTLPAQICETLVRFGVPAEAMAGLDDLYRHLGPGVMDALSEVVDAERIPASALGPAQLERIRPTLGARFLRQRHASWRAGLSTPGFWRDRSYAGAASGLVIPLGDLAQPATPTAARVAAAARETAGLNQPPPRGLLLLSQGSHRNSQADVFAFDLVPSELEEALAVNDTAGRHHTLPGSVGETSGRLLSDPEVAIVWETQPNLFKPQGERNRGAGRAYRRHRLWPLVTAAAAFHHLLESGRRVFVLKGASLKAAHEADPGQPLVPETERLHDLTMSRAAAALGLRLHELRPAEEPREPLRLAKVNLGVLIAERGFAAVAWELRA